MKKSSKNALYGVIDVLIAPVLMIIVTPIFLRHLGVQDYAIWILINSIIASLSLFNFAGTDLFYALFLISCKYISPYLPEAVLENSTILYVAIPMFFLKQFEQLLFAFFKGYEEYNHVAFLSLFSKIVFFSTQAITAVISNSVYQVFQYGLIASALIFIFEVIYIKVIHNDAVLLKEVNFEKAKSLIHFGGWNWLTSIIGIFWVNSDKWMVTVIFGLKTLGLYSLGILVFNQLHNIFAASISWVFPKISKEGENGTNRLRNYYYLTSLIVIFSYIISITLNQLDFIFELWLGIEAYLQSKIYIKLFLIMLPVYTLPLVSYYHLLGLGLVKEKFMADTSILVIKIVALYAAMVILKLDNWPLAFLVYISIQFILYVKILCKHMHIKFYQMILILLTQLFVVFIRIDSI